MIIWRNLLSCSYFTCGVGFAGFPPICKKAFLAYSRKTAHVLRYMWRMWLYDLFFSDICFFRIFFIFLSLYYAYY